MAEIIWENIWNDALKDPRIFPNKKIKNNTFSVACPTRFSNTGEFSIDITPSFNEDSISLEMLLFNDNIQLEDIKEIGDKTLGFNTLANSLVKYELSNRIMDRFDIESEGFKTDKEAENALIDYINNKATESGRMFDDKLDELNDEIESVKNNIDTAKESYNKYLNTIRENRKYILKKVESIFKKRYKWHASKNEDFNDSTASFFDKNGNLVAVVSLVDDTIIIDLSKHITAKISVLQSDEEIEKEIANDISNANKVLADQEIDQLKNVIANNNDNYMESLSRRLTKLESLYIRNRIRNFKHRS